MVDRDRATGGREAAGRPAGGRDPAGRDPAGREGDGPAPWERYRVGETEPRVLGLPTRWLPAPRPPDLPWLRHPRRWVAWRREVRRLGPYARPWDQHRSGPPGPPPGASDGLGDGVE